jgi:hypothetical protein
MHSLFMELRGIPEREWTAIFVVALAIFWCAEQRRSQIGEQWVLKRAWELNVEVVVSLVGGHLSIPSRSDPGRRWFRR